MDENFGKIIKSLSSAIIDDFRGFINNNGERIEVPDDTFHALIAVKELSKLSDWEYKSGVGQNPIVDFMNRRAIYLTKIPYDGKNGKTEFQRTVGYLTNSYTNDIIYKGEQLKEYEVLRKIAVGMGYDVDEYTFEENKTNTLTPPTSVTNFKGNIVVKQSKSIIPNHSRRLSDGDVPVLDSNGNLLGFKVHGKFVSREHYERYSNGHNLKSDNEQTR